MEHNITLEVEWLPRGKNVIADNISQFVDYDDWQVEYWFFKMMDSFWGPHTVDLFANNLNNKVQQFYSRFWTEGSSGVDSFVQNWGLDTCWIVPQFSGESYMSC